MEYLKPSKQTLAASNRIAIRQIFNPMAPGDENGLKSERYLVKLLLLYILEGKLSIVLEPIQVITIVLSV